MSKQNKTKKKHLLYNKQKHLKALKKHTYHCLMIHHSKSNILHAHVQNKKNKLPKISSKKDSLVVRIMSHSTRHQRKATNRKIQMKSLP